MSITINPPQSAFIYRKDAASSVTPLIPSFDMTTYSYASSQFPTGDNVKVALDELFRLSTPPGPEYELHDAGITGSSSATFVVPAGVSELLVLLINSGQNGSSGKAGIGREAYSFYVYVSPGQEIPVSVTTNTYQRNGSVAFGNFGTYKDAVPVENRLFNAKAGDGSNNSSSPGAGGGGFWTEHSVYENNPAYDDIRAEEWLSVALTNQPEGAPTNASGNTPGKCWPFTSETGDTPTSNGGGGASYGGGGGNERTSGSTTSPGLGGQGFIAIFWGKKIRPAGTEAFPAIPLTT